MDNNNDLEKYIGWKCNNMTINTIEYEFRPYKSIICDINSFNEVIFLNNTIRLLVIERVIKDIKFN